ncbi:Short-chain dehydrogenase/reductase SDR [Penicillium occitanis (nom. inval.)]|nr:Short-chain dehydrogenase/reductase SDR [Penicillium occitanis (nom. inval.)]PCH03385.1 hypothetical protein PENOC_038860 [Penicillium occitanis (nom. inval.)]
MAALTFQSKVAIVTGCSSGIGLSTTLSFLSHGAKVLGIDVASFDHSIPEDLKSSFVFHQADLTLANAISDAITACKSNFGPRIDILINGAGVGDGFSSADAVTNGEWDRVISINLSVPVKLMRAVLPSMVEHQHGAIVNICSRASDSGATAGIAYTASKHGLAGATKNVAWRFRNQGIRCNAVCPGGVVTNIGKSVNMEWFDPAGFAEFQPIFGLHVSNDQGTGLPAPHIKPEDVADGILFLASEKAKKINGVLLPIDTAWSTI